MTEWFEQWFGAEYHALYPHRDADDARRAVALVWRAAPWRAGERVLDLACGGGRHAAELERLGAHVVGVDLSPAMLRGARGRVRGPLVRGDMRRLPFRAASFTLAVNLFTSFGYFRDEAEHHLVVRQVAAALAPGGRFVLDYLNADQVRTALGANGSAASAARSPRITRRLSDDGRFVVKEIALADEGRSFQERVRLFTAAELAALLTGAGFELADCYGDYDGSGLGAAAPRAIFVGVKRGPVPEREKR
jgi:SAM-dependent methyltransferase